MIQKLQEMDPMLYTYLKRSKAYFDGTRVLIDGGKTFRDFIRANKDSQRPPKTLKTFPSRADPGWKWL